VLHSAHNHQIHTKVARYANYLLQRVAVQYYFVNAYIRAAFYDHLLNLVEESVRILIFPIRPLRNEVVVAIPRRLDTCRFHYAEQRYIVHPHKNEWQRRVNLHACASVIFDRQKNLHINAK
jgi:hypothetical protein